MWDPSGVGAGNGVAAIWSGIRALVEARKKMSENRHVACVQELALGGLRVVARHGWE